MDDSPLDNDYTRVAWTCPRCGSPNRSYLEDPPPICYWCDYQYFDWADVPYTDERDL